MCDVNSKVIENININQGRVLEINPIDSLVDYDDPMFMEYYYRHPEMYRATVDDIIESNK